MKRFWVFTIHQKKRNQHW